MCSANLKLPKVHRDLTRLLLGNPGSLDPLPYTKVDGIYREKIRRLTQLGSFTAPSHQFKGAHFQSGASSSQEEKWENIKTLWDGWGEN